ncbi:MAG: hypothetical protein ACOYK8_00410 [Alphaproteobacteria bacterium]
MRFLLTFIIALLCSPALAQPKVTVLDNGWLAVDDEIIYPDCLVDFSLDNASVNASISLSKCHTPPKDGEYHEMDYKVLGKYQDKYIIDVIFTTYIGSMENVVDIKFNFNDEDIDHSTIELTNIYDSSEHPYFISFAGVEFINNQILAFTINLGMSDYLSRLGIKKSNNQEIFLDSVKRFNVATIYENSLLGKEPYIVQIDIDQPWLYENLDNIKKELNIASSGQIEKCVQEISLSWIKNYGGMLKPQEISIFIDKLVSNCDNLIEIEESSN